MKNIFEILGKRIKTERQKRGLTQEGLAEAAGISNNFVSYIENGKKTASINTVKKIADVFEMPISKLFSEIPLEKKATVDYTTEKIMYLIRDKSPSKKKLFLSICESIVKNKK